MSRNGPLIAGDLRGRRAISYLRFSSSPQEKGSTIERQQAVLDSILSRCGLVLDQALMDKALSASTGHHRKRGHLGDLLKLVERKEIAPGIVLIVEAIDRLTRERFFDAFDVIKTLIKGGLILVTGDLTVWDDEAINSPMNHKLVAEINAARAYTDRLRDLSSAAHASRRRKMELLADNPVAPGVILNSRPPGWLIREGMHYVLHPDHAQTVRIIYQMCRDGNSVRQIAAKLNGDGVALLGNAGGVGTEWRAPRVGQILRDEKVLGFVQPCIRVGNKRVPTGNRVKLYPQVIDASAWVQARELLTSRRDQLKGRRGRLVANLFTGKVFCATCGGAMRVDTGGRTRKDGSRQRKLLCARFAESKTCGDRTRYDLHHYEPLILLEIAARSSVVPRGTPQSTRAAAETLAAVRIKVEMLAESIATLAPRIGSSATLADQVERMSKERDALRRKADVLEVEQQAASAGVSRSREVWDFIKALIRPALSGDAGARERLRSLLSRVDFRIVGDRETPIGGVLLTVAGETVTIEPAGYQDEPDDYQGE